MPSTELAHFFNVALDIQAPPYPGIHVADGLIAATNHVMRVAKTYSTEFLRGEGAISPKAVRVLEALANVTWISRIEVDDNRVCVTAQTTRYDEKLGGEVAGEYQAIVLPDFYCRQIPIKRMIGALTDERLFWANIAENPTLKTLREAGAKDYVSLRDAPPRTNGELFRPKTDTDTYWYSAAQLRRGLRLFGTKAHLRVRCNRDGWLVFEDRWGQTFAVTPFTKRG